jgi:hypothetical protein
MTRDPSAQRDAHLRLVRRLRVGLVSAGVAGSLGVAGVVATHAPNATSGDSSSGSGQPVQVGGTTTPGTTTPGTTTPGTSGDDGFSGWRDDAGEDDGGRAQQQPQQQTQLQAPGLQQGFGRSHGSTSGS